MKINVDAPVKKDAIKQVLLNHTEVSYTFLGNPRPTVLQFEVDETTVPGGNAIAYTKSVIKASPAGMSVFRVLEDGKNW